MPLCCPISIFSVTFFTVTFTRLRPFYVINLIVPAMLLSVCMVLTFLLPTECGERLGYSMTILLSYTVLMTITAEMMPTTSKETPHISRLRMLLLSIQLRVESVGTANRYSSLWMILTSSCMDMADVCTILYQTTC